MSTITVYFIGGPADLTKRTMDINSIHGEIHFALFGEIDINEPIEKMQVLPTRKVTYRRLGTITISGLRNELYIFQKFMEE